MVADLTPASSPCVSSRYSILKPCFSAQRVYMRSSISAQSWLSVPPAPAWTSRKLSLASASPDKSASAPRALGFGLERIERRFGLLDHLGIVLGLAELDHGELVLELLLDARDPTQVFLERGALLHHFLRALLVLPQIRVLGLPIELGEPCLRLVEVKDASSAARRTA